jgi:hypothetical protein
MSPKSLPTVKITGLLSGFAICISNNADFPFEYLLASIDDACFIKRPPPSPPTIITADGDDNSEQLLHPHQQQFNCQCLFWPSDMAFMKTISTYNIEQMPIEDLGSICNSIFKGRKVIIEADERYHDGKLYHNICTIKLTD